MATQTEFRVPTIDCEGCARTIKGALGRVSGIDLVEVDVPAKRVRVEYDAIELDEARVRDAVEAAGFPIEA